MVNHMGVCCGSVQAIYTHKIQGYLFIDIATIIWMPTYMWSNFHEYK